jgi:hypothetical protein
MMTPCDNTLLNDALTDADLAYNRGDMAVFSAILACINRCFFPLSIIPQV